jgi:hypothetical protein
MTYLMHNFSLSFILSLQLQKAMIQRAPNLN